MKLKKKLENYREYFFMQFDYPTNSDKVGMCVDVRFLCK